MDANYAASLVAGAGVWSAAALACAPRDPDRLLNPIERRRASVRAWSGRQITAEYQFLAGLDHPGLLRPVALGPGRAVYADTQCTLDEYFPWAGRLPPVHVANVLAQAAALEVVHAVRRGHGGVGADSLPVGAGGDVVFAEFAGKPCGGSPPPPDPAPKYLAPELLDSGLGRWGPAADL